MTCLLLRNNYITLKLYLSYSKEVKNVFTFIHRFKFLMHVQQVLHDTV